MFFFCYGTSPFLEFEIEKIIKETLEKFQGISPKFYDCSLKEEENFFISLQSNSIFTPFEFLILKRAETLKSSGITKLIKSIKEYDLSKKILLVSYNLPMQYNKPVAEYELTKAVVKSIEEIANLVDCTNTKEKNKIHDYVKEKLKISEKDTKNLVEVLGNDYYTIKNEVDKIAIFLDGEEYSYEKIKNLISVDKEYSLKELLDDFFKTKNPINLLNYINKNKDAYMGLIYMLGDEISTFLKLSSLIADGKISQNMNYNVFKELYENISDLFLSKNFKALHPYVVYLKLNSFKVENENFYIKRINDLLELEYRMKNGEADIEIELPLYLMNFYN